MSYGYSSSTTQAHAHSPSASDGGPLSRANTVVNTTNIVQTINQDGLLLKGPAKNKG